MNEIVHAHLPGRAARASADAAAANSRHHRSRLFLSRPHLAAVAGVQHRERDRHAFRRRLARTADGVLGDQGRPAMSDDDDPFGRRDRTIIRPNPRRTPCRRRLARRRPPPPAGGAPRPRRLAAADRPPTVRSLVPPQLAAAATPPPPGQANWDGWSAPPAPPPVNPYLQRRRRLGADDAGAGLAACVRRSGDGRRPIR